MIKKVCCTFIFEISNIIINIFLFPLMLLTVTARAIMLGTPSAIIPVFRNAVKKQKEIEKAEYRNLLRQMTQQN